MATRQYIGARYVPIFDGEWDNTKEYEPLVIVSNLGNSYTSRTYVPAGVDISNTKYWALTGNYNAQIEAYRQDVENYKNEVIEYEGSKLFFVKNDDNVDKINGNCVIYINGDVVTMFDLSYDLNYQNIVDILTDNGVDHIDNVVISHYHLDHSNINNLSALIAANYIDNRTLFYLPKKSNNPSVWTSGLETIYNNFISVLTDNNITYSFPTNTTSITINNASINFFNCSDLDIAYYDDLTADYNNYSMCSYINDNGKRVAIMGDCYNVAQKRIYDSGYAKKCDLITTGHHADSNWNNNFQLTIMPEYAVVMACKSALFTSAFNSGNEISLLTAHGTKLYTTCDSYVAFNLAKSFDGIYQNLLEINFNYLNVINVYVDNAYTGPSIGTSDKPFKSLKEALSFALLFKGCRVQINGNGVTVSDSLIINNYECELILSNINFGSVRFQNMVVELSNCSFTSTESNALRFDNSIVGGNNVTINGDTYSQASAGYAGINIRNSKVSFTTLNINDKGLGIITQNNSEVRIGTINCNHVNYINDTLESSSIFVESISGNYSNKNTLRTKNASGALWQVRDIKSVISVGNADVARYSIEGNIVSLELDISGLSLSSAETLIGTLTNGQPIVPKYVRRFSIIGVNGGLTAGDYSPVLLEIGLSGAIKVITSNYANVTRIVGTVTYLID